MPVLYAVRTHKLWPDCMRVLPNMSAVRTRKLWPDCMRVHPGTAIEEDWTMLGFFLKLPTDL